MKQIRSVFGDNFRDNFPYLSIKTCYGYSLKSPWRGDSNDYPQHMFSWRTVEIIP